jgi:hypothetical protein
VSGERLCEHVFVGNAGTPHGRFQHAIERGNLIGGKRSRAGNSGRLSLVTPCGCACYSVSRAIAALNRPLCGGMAALRSKRADLASRRRSYRQFPSWQRACLYRRGARSLTPPCRPPGLFCFEVAG